MCARAHVCVCARSRVFCVCVCARSRVCVCARAHALTRKGGRLCRSVCMGVCVGQHNSFSFDPTRPHYSHNFLFQNYTPPRAPHTHTFAGDGASWLDTVLESSQILWYLPKYSSIYLICETSNEKRERERESISNYSRTFVRLIWHSLGALVGAGRG